MARGMSEAKWQASADPTNMLRFWRSRMSDRKLRLFACACCRQVWELLRDERSHRNVETAEDYADGLVAHEKLAEANCHAHGAVCQAVMNTHARVAVQFTTGVNAYDAAYWSIGYAIDLAHSPEQAQVFRAAKCDFLRDIVGNPFRPTRAVLCRREWGDWSVSRLAKTIYDDRAFNCMPILADALEEAGCTDADVLNHCRNEGPHIRGCWVLDLILGKS